MAGEYVIIKQNHYMRAFRKAGATDTVHARPPGELGIQETRIFRRMVAKGVFVAVGREAYFIDQNAAVEFIAWRRKRAFLALVLILIVLLAFFVFSAKMFR